MIPRLPASLRALATALLVAPAATAQCEFPEKYRIAPSDGMDGDSFGYRVAASPGWIAAGSPFHDQGAVYLYDRSPLLEETQLLPPDAAASRFGFSIALAGDLLIVGDPEHGGWRGRVDIFREVGSSWQHEGFLEGTENLGRFGQSVSFDPPSGWLAVGAPEQASAGRVHLYRREAGGWVHEVGLTTVGSATDLFGMEVEVEGARLAVGNPGHDGHRGRVHLFEWNGSQWSLRPSIQHPDTQAGDRFGGDLDLHGDRLLIGARGHSHAGPDAGAAFLYHRSGDDWIDPVRFLPPGPDPDGVNFGGSVQLGDELVSIGAWLADFHWDDQGSVFQWRRRGAQWVPLQRLVDHRYIGDQYHGFDHVVLGDEVFVGAPGVHANGVRAGAVYVHDIPDFALHLNAEALHLGQLVDFRFCGGDPGRPVLMYVVALNDAPLSLRLATSSFDAKGEWSIQGSHGNPALSDLWIDFQGISLTSEGKVEASNVGTLHLY